MDLKICIALCGGGRGEECMLVAENLDQWLVVCLSGWLVVWLVVCLSGWLAGWLVVYTAPSPPFNLRRTMSCPGKQLLAFQDDFYNGTLTWVTLGESGIWRFFVQSTATFK